MIDCTKTDCIECLRREIRDLKGRIAELQNPSAYPSGGNGTASTAPIDYVAQYEDETK